MTLPPTVSMTPSQTIGPFSHEGWRWATAITDDAPRCTTAITISGVLRDGAGAVVNDGMIEAWAPDAAAGEADHALPGFRRVASDDDGRFTLSLPRPQPGQPVALITLFARGLVLHQFSAVFLDDDAALDQAAILQQVPAARRATLIARNTGPATYEWNIVMQGEHETVFFDYAGAP